MTIQIQPPDFEALLMALLVAGILSHPDQSGVNPSFAAKHAHDYLKGIKKVLEQERGEGD
ncbi:MAG: hypothetical protein WAT29_02140 [Thiolinea sp.]